MNVNLIHIVLLVSLIVQVYINIHFWLDTHFTKSLLEWARSCTNTPAVSRGPPSLDGLQERGSSV